jgi:hypothetical protein
MVFVVRKCAGAVGAPFPRCCRSFPGSFAPALMARRVAPSLGQADGRRREGRRFWASTAQHLQQLACIIPRGSRKHRLANWPSRVLIIALRRGAVSSLLPRFLRQTTVAYCPGLPLTVIVVCTPSSSLVMCIPCRLHLRACSHCVPSGAVMLQKSISRLDNGSSPAGPASNRCHLSRHCWSTRGLREVDRPASLVHS